MSTSDDGELAPEPFVTGPEADSGEEAIDPVVGQVLGGRYRVLERLAEGGMGTVYRAEHIALRKEVAIKLVQDGANSDHAMRFLREAMLTSRIDHPNVISAIDYGTFEDGAAYLVMSLVEGPTLAHVMEVERPMSWARAAEIGAQIADAVAASHAQGIVHRDLKPENLVLQPLPDGTDVVKLLDFGIAKYARDSLAPPPVRGAQQVTRMGVVIGTPGFMAPEQAIGMRADHRADLYSIGVILWECVVGRRLWDCADIQHLLTAQLGSRPPLVRAESGDPTIPEAFEAFVAALLATRPEHRPQTAVETRDRLRALVEAERRESQPLLDLRPIAQPKLIVVTPPPHTSTVFIEAALARWNLAAGEALRDAERANDASAAQPETRDATTLVLGEAVRQPTTQVGFRGADRASQGDAALEFALSAQPHDESAADIGSVAALQPEGERADPVVLPRTSLRRYAAAALGLAVLSVILWAALARDASSPRASVAKSERGVARSSVAAPVAPALLPAQSTAAVNAPSALPPAPPLQSASTSTRSRGVLVATAVAPTKPARLSVPARTSSTRGDAAELRANARAHFARAEFALAAQSYRLAIKAAPAYAGAYAGLGASQYALGDARGAIASYEQAIRRSPATSGFHAALGRACVMAHDRARAVAEYRTAVALDPTNDVASNALAKLAP